MAESAAGRILDQHAQDKKLPANGKNMLEQVKQGLAVGDKAAKLVSDLIALWDRIPPGLLG